MKHHDSSFKTDWAAIGPVLAQEAAKVVSGTAQHLYQGMNVYCSYDSTKPADKKFKNWLTNTLDTFPGVHVFITERQKKKSGPICPACHLVVTKCPACNSDIRGTEEKGIDTRIVTDMMSLAWANNYDVAVIVSADRDFVPVAEFLQTKGLKVIHGSFPPSGAILTQKCWGSLDISLLGKGFQRL